MEAETVSKPEVVRWRIFGLLVMAAMVLYFQQKSITVASERIMPALTLSQVQIGWLQWAFVAAYGFFQIPGSIWGQRIGARLALSITGVVAILACAALPLAPLFFSGTALFVVMFLSQFLLGLAHAPFFPVCAGVMESWLPSRVWSLAQGIHTCGSQVGAALAPPLLVALISAFAWQKALFIAAWPPILLVGIWWVYVRNTPQEHPALSVDQRQSMQSAPAPDAALSVRSWFPILRHRSVWAMAASYVCMNYVFYLLANWTFLFLIQQRHFSVFESSWMAAIPPMGAALGAGVGGGVTLLATQKLGNAWGYRVMPMVMIPLAGLLLWVAIAAHASWIAVGALVLSYFLIELSEGSYWGGAMRVGGSETMAVTGIVNTGGNLGGVIGIPIVAYLSAAQRWDIAFGLGVVFAIVAALLWLIVDVDHPIPRRGIAEG